MSITDDLVAKTLQELNSPDKTDPAKSRVWKDPQGYTYLVQWSNSVLLRYFIRLFTNDLPRREYRRKAQLDDAGRSIVRNIEEGYKRSTTRDYINFVGYSQGSLEEVKGDIRELTEDTFLPSKPGSNLASISINLSTLNEALKNHYHPLKSSKELKEIKDPKGDYRRVFNYVDLTEIYPPLGKIKADHLTYEIFIELINKTDYLLRQLVLSLEKKLTQNQRYYQVDRLRA